MAETPVPVKPYQFNLETFKAKLKELEAVRDAKVGKSNYNPFLWYRENVSDLARRAAQGERSEVLFKALFDVKAEVPPLNVKAVVPEPVLLPKTK